MIIPMSRHLEIDRNGGGSGEVAERQAFGRPSMFGSAGDRSLQFLELRIIASLQRDRRRACAASLLRTIP
jgi:hypothetical protein